jgi:exosome complex RNA-binding protein Csl4
MVAIPKVVGVLSCGFLLCLGLSNVASSADELNTGQSGGKMLTVSDKDNFQAGKEVKGAVVRVEGDNYVVREDSGNEVRMHVDATTETKSKLKPKPGDHVIAKVNDKGHAISFLTDQPISH